jgi:hypothetical protein
MAEGAEAIAKPGFPSCLRCREAAAGDRLFGVESGGTSQSVSRQPTAVLAHTGMPAGKQPFVVRGVPTPMMERIGASLPSAGHSILSMFHIAAAHLSSSWLGDALRAWLNRGELAAALLHGVTLIEQAARRL